MSATVVASYMASWRPLMMGDVEDSLLDGDV